MRLIEEVIEDGDQLSIRISPVMQRFLAVFFDTNPSKAEKTIVAHIQTVGTWKAWNPDELAAETGFTRKQIDEALSRLIENSIVQMKAICDESGQLVSIEPMVNYAFA